MKKSELLKLLEPFDDEEVIHTHWDDRIWPIDGVTRREDGTGLFGSCPESSTGCGKVCIDS